MKSAAMPHQVVGSAADPIALEPVDDAVVTTLVDNVYDALLTGDNITRAPLPAGTAKAPQSEPGFTNVGLIAEQGFSAWPPAPNTPSSQTACRAAWAWLSASEGSRPRDQPGRR